MKNMIMFLVVICLCAMTAFTQDKLVPGQTTRVINGETWTFKGFENGIQLWGIDETYEKTTKEDCGCPDKSKSSKGELTWEEGYGVYKKGRDDQDEAFKDALLTINQLNKNQAYTCNCGSGGSQQQFTPIYQGQQIPQGQSLVYYDQGRWMRGTAIANTIFNGMGTLANIGFGAYQIWDSRNNNWSPLPNQQSPYTQWSHPGNNGSGWNQHQQTDWQPVGTGSTGWTGTASPQIPSGATSWTH